MLNLPRLRTLPQRGSVWEGIQQGAGCGSSHARLLVAVNWTAVKVSLGDSRGPHRLEHTPLRRTTSGQGQGIGARRRCAAVLLQQLRP